MTVYLQPAAVPFHHVQDNRSPKIRPAMVHATGRSVVMDEETVEEARALALEDALYYAAFKAAQRLNGYSAVDETTCCRTVYCPPGLTHSGLCPLAMSCG